MEKKLILKLKLSNKDRMLIKTSDNTYEVANSETLSNVITMICSLLNIQGVNNAVPRNLENLQELVKQGFTIRIDELDDHLRFMDFKDKASITFGVSKEMGISRLLHNAEDFAEEFLKEENITKTIKGKGIDSLLETIDEIFESI